MKPSHSQQKVIFPTEAPEHKNCFTLGWLPIQYPEPWRHYPTCTFLYHTYSSQGTDDNQRSAISG